jgi:hypothetical protein
MRKIEAAANPHTKILESLPARQPNMRRLAHAVNCLSRNPHREPVRPRATGKCCLRGERIGHTGRRTCSDFVPQIGEHVLADIDVDKFPTPAVTGEGVIRVPVTVTAIEGNQATVEFDVTVARSQAPGMVVPGLSP